ncbi:lytic transglycosylase domain-containing protein [Pseudophaeobacter sp.]|uniref:lytic transglycosylase domain-containing protein n=1 Tax=Pseudophaeobacter sp. TaxID=1971739 RepID=UPI0032980EA8
MTRILLFLSLILMLGSVAMAQTRPLERALEQVHAENWSQALQTAGAPGSVARDIIEWHRLRAKEGTAEDVEGFLARRPDWPGLPYLRRRTEELIIEKSHKRVRAFFANQAPQTPEGAASLARAYFAKGEQALGTAELIRAWQNMPMSEETQAAYLADHAQLLKPHHAARLSQLLWDSHDASATRMLPLVNAGERALAEARIALQKQSKGVDAKIEAVPAELQDDPGLAYDRFAWRDGKRRQDDAIALMLDRSTSAQALGQPEKWLRRRRDLARQLMRDGKHERAYQLAAHHFSATEVGYGYSDCEWLAGYIALRKLNDAELAVHHFERFLASIETPISVGRGGYWLGRAHAARGDVDKAHAAYAKAAEFQTSFYGLLAAEALGREFDPALATPPQLPPWRSAGFLDSSVIEAALLLLQAGDLTLAERFFTHQVESLSPIEAQQIGQMAVEMKEPHLAVMIAKRAAQAGVELHGAYYPLHPVAQQKLPMAAEMTLAIARRESEFDPVVISHAGARGLMQLMPATAKLVAKELDILAKHNTARLTAEWDYNAELGSQYLAGLAAEFNGNVVMMAAGYNAGPRRPEAWMKRYGDPRSGSPDIVDWIEHIPFNETRNYVMRVTESLPAYRARLGKAPLPVPFSKELSGASLAAFAP